MKKLLFFLLLSTAVFSCGDDDIVSPTTVVNLHFKAVYDGSPLVMYEKYTYPDNHLIRFQTFNFFIADVALLEDTGADEAELVDIEFVDFSNNTTTGEAETPVSFTKTKVPAGTYKGIRVNIGVPADLNNSAAGQFGAGHPLKKTFTSHFWSDWKSFIFMKSEGSYDLDGDGTFSASDRGFEHHPGTNDVFQTVTILSPIVLEEGKPFDLNLVVDILKVYEKDGIALDLSDPANKDTQEASDLPLANYLVGNFTQALTFQ